MAGRRRSVVGGFLRATEAGARRITKALFVALGGLGYAALKGKDKRKVRAIADQEISKQAQGLNVASAGSAAKLGGTPAPGFQRFCSAGGIKATVVVNTTGASNTNFTDVPGFNCFRPGNTTSSVQLERLAQGQYFVRFVGNSAPDASGSAQTFSLLAF